VFVTDITQQDVYAALRTEHFPERPHPAESFVEVSSLADPAWMIEIEAIGLIHQGAHPPGPTPTPPPAGDCACHADPRPRHRGRTLRSVGRFPETAVTSPVPRR
jgi:hypothetical protein